MKKNIKYKLKLSYSSFVLLLIAASFLVISGAKALGNSTMYFIPANPASINIGDTIDLNATVAPGPTPHQVSSFSARITYDQTKLSLTSITCAPSFNTELYKNIPVTQDGSARIDCAVSGGSSAVTAITTAATFSFTALAVADDSPVSFTAQSSIGADDVLGVNVFDGNTTTNGSLITILDQGGTPPTLLEVTPVTTPTNDPTPSYTFSSNVASTISYPDASCDSASAPVVNGNEYTITFDSLADGVHACPIRVEETATPTNFNTITTNAFTIDTTAPTITSVSSDKAAGAYKVGEVIDIDVNFSEAVTSTVDLTVTLETGTTDRTCTFAVSNSATGTCNYTVQAGDTSADLTVNTIAGTIADQATNAMTNFVPATNLAANEAIVIDTTVPTITSVSSDKVAGTYEVGEIIDIDVNFSEAITSTGNVTVTLETGTTDRTCTFAVSNSASGTCNYTVQAGDISADLTVNTIAGTIADQATNAMTNFVPATNLAANEAIVIDTTAPTGGSFTIDNDAAEATSTAVTLNVTCPTDAWGTVQMAFGNSAAPSNWTTCASTTPHTLSAGDGSKTVYMRFRDGGQNTSSDITDTITLNLPDTTPPVLSAGSPSGVLSAGTTQSTVSFTTNEAATCGYDTVLGTAYDSMTNFILPLGTTHSFTATGLTNGNSYAYFVRCKDDFENANIVDYLISFSVANPVVVKKSSSHSDSKKSTPARTITNSKSNIKNGQILTQRGKKFSKNSIVLLYFSRYGGTYYAPVKIKTSSTGSFMTTYRVNKHKGTYTWYAVDSKTGKKSKIIHYHVKL